MVVSLPLTVAVWAHLRLKCGRNALTLAMVVSTTSDSAPLVSTAAPAPVRCSWMCRGTGAGEAPRSMAERYLTRRSRLGDDNQAPRRTVELGAARSQPSELSPAARPWDRLRQRGPPAWRSPAL